MHIFEELQKHLLEIQRPHTHDWFDGGRSAPSIQAFAPRARENGCPCFRPPSTKRGRMQKPGDTAVNVYYFFLRSPALFRISPQATKGSFTEAHPKPFSRVSKP